jgi:hypothetical protein
MRKFVVGKSVAGSIPSEACWGAGREFTLRYTGVVSGLIRIRMSSLRPQATENSKDLGVGESQGSCLARGPTANFVLNF